MKKVTNFFKKRHKLVKKRHKNVNLGDKKPQTNVKNALKCKFKWKKSQYSVKNTHIHKMQT